MAPEPKAPPREHAVQALIETLPDLIGAAVEANQLWGYLVIGMLMFFENVVPPIPSELIMPLAGFLVAQGKLALLPVVVAGLSGTLLGAWLWYGVGRLISEERLARLLARHGRWIGLHPNDLARSRRWFQRHGHAVVFWGRILPGVRTLVSVPAGLELIPQLPFLLWSGAGSLIWILFLSLAGMTLGEHYEQAAARIAPFAHVIQVVLVLAVLVVVARVALVLLRTWRDRRGRGLD
ncbi:DedA family protein [Synechococcus sp. CCY9202]|nr:DedA family protein [Synechococcus sp. CCY9202]